jgi:hypothetical protein
LLSGWTEHRGGGGAARLPEGDGVVSIVPGTGATAAEPVAPWPAAGDGRAAKDLIAGRLTDIEVLYRWSRRWMDGALAASKTKQERIAAAEAHLKRMKDLERVAPELKKVAYVFPASSEAAATYYRLEAEASLEEARR